MTHAELQRLWDATLVQTWRRFGTLHDAIDAWQAVAKQSPFSPDLQLRRIPPGGMPWKIGVRVFVASYLPKISDRLWAQPPERDEALVDKLQGSNYTTQTKALRSDTRRDMENLGRDTKVNRARLAGDQVLYGLRQKDSDWTTTKAPVRRRRLK